MKRYKKGNKFYAGNIILNDRMVFNPSEGQILEAGYEEYVEPKNEETIESAKQAKIIEIENYDKSENVNKFLLNGYEMWLSKADRVGLSNSLAIEEAAGRTETTIWTRGDNPVEITISISKAKEMLSELELYALKCYNITQKHKKEVNNLNNISYINKYDVSLGYPDIINLTV